MSPTSVQAVAGTLTEKVARDLITALEATPEEKAHWQPAGEARPMIAQLVECCLANTKWTAILQTRTHANLPREVAQEAYRELNTREKVAARLRETSATLAQTIRALPEDALSAPVELPWNRGVTRSLAECCFHAYWNMAYHEGQINYIQTMYGDFDQHADSGPFGV
jgi:uncharacterized damage-inducible protein DinB